MEDEEKIAAGICSKISSLDPDFVIVGKASNGKEALELLNSCHPHVIFTDIAMPEMNGMELSREIRRSSPNTVIVIISGYSDFSYAQQSMKYGVFNYLLKPLQDDALLETMFDIKKSLSHFAVREQRHILYSDSYDVISDEKEKFLLANICIGNVIYNMQDEEVLGFYQYQCRQIQWGKIMSELFAEEIEWFVADEHSPNQKMIAVKIKHAECRGIFEMMQKLPVLVQEYTDLPVSICSTKNGVLKEEIWDYTKRLRNIMKQRLVIGHNCCFYLEEDEKFSNDMLEIVKMKLNTYIKNYFISTDLKNFLNEMQTIFKYMESNHAPQESIEKVCLYVIRLVELSATSQTTENLENIQERMIRNISMFVSEKELFEKLLEEFQKLNRYMETIYALGLSAEEYDKCVQDGMLLKDQKGKEPILYMSRSLGDKGIKLIGEITMDELRIQKRELSLFIGIMLVLALVAAGISAWFVSNRITKPLGELMEIMEKIRTDEKSSSLRFPEGNTGEIGILGSRFNELMDELDASMQQIYEEQRERRHNEVRLLQAQIVPHFLYNTMGIISSFIKLDMPDKALKTIQNLIEYMEYSIECEEDAEKVWIPKLTIQPLMENAIHHGLKHGGEKCRIHAGITLDKEQGYLRICVYDNGAGIKTERLEQLRHCLETGKSITKSFGITNIHQRLKLLYGEKYHMEIDSTEGEYTQFVLFVPLENRDGGEEHV